MTKDELLSLLWQNADAYISGEELARRLSVSRTAVWKAIGQLREDKYGKSSCDKYQRKKENSEKNYSGG